MEYQVALLKAWENLQKSAQNTQYSLPFLNDTYSVDLEKRTVFCESCNVGAKPFYSIIILHYLAKRETHLEVATGEWMSFKELPGGQGYYSNFKKRVLEVIVRKYRDQPDALLNLSERFSTRKEDLADSSIVLNVAQGVSVLINFWRGDDEFGPEANVLFDKNISKIFCTEDIVVLAEIIAHSI